MHDNSKRMFARHALPFFAGAERVLEVGPDRLPSTYERLVRAAGGASAPAEWHTVDLASRPGTTFAARSEYEFPIADASYDVVVSGQVLEHVRKPWRWLPELARVCRPGGAVVTISPVSWPYHEAPVDCWRIYPEGLRALHEDAGLEVLHCSWGTLEPAGLLPRCPRPYSDHAPGTVYKLARLLRWPLARAYDAVTVARKPIAATPARALCAAAKGT
jgi:SAM-dependent methyltransferase